MFELISEKKRSSRTTCDCYECGAIIYPTCKYLDQRIKYENAMHVHKICIKCGMLRDLLKKSGHCFRPLQMIERTEDIIELSQGNATEIRNFFEKNYRDVLA